MPSTMRDILKLDVPIVVRLGHKLMPIREVTGLVPGTIVDLGRSAEAELDLLVNNRQIGRGRAVKIGENFGIRITAIGTGPERVQAVAAEPERPGGAMSPEDLAEAMINGEM